MYCICCKQDNIKPLSHKRDVDPIEEDHIWSVEEIDQGNGKKSRSNCDNRMWNGGIVQVINAGYGSGHDTDQYIIAICDDCISKESEDGTLLYYGNYMNHDDRYQKEELAKSKLIYRRRKNLDKLV